MSINSPTGTAWEGLPARWGNNYHDKAATHGRLALCIPSTASVAGGDGTQRGQGTRLTSLR